MRSVGDIYKDIHVLRKASHEYDVSYLISLNEFRIAEIRAKFY